MLETINPEILNYVDNLVVPHSGKIGGIGKFMHDISVAGAGNSHFGRKFLHDLAWYFPSEEGSRSACLPIVGGFAAEDTDFLLAVIYKSTMPLQVAMRKIRIHEFATFLFLAWQQLIFLDA